MADDATIVLTDMENVLDSATIEAKNRPACFLAISGEISGKLFDLKPGVIIVGRGADNLIDLDFAGISRKHLKITVAANEEDEITVIATDLGSKNGTFINNVKLTGSLQLTKGDQVKLGAITLKFIPRGDPERLAYDKLNKDAVTDGLTTCYNKLYFNQTCEALVKKSRATGKTLSLVLFDLDHFKNLNDTYGHDAGDFVLKELAQIVRSNAIRESDIFARYGGEEFVVLLPETNLKNGFVIAERIRQTIEKYEFNYHGQRLPVTASLGVADYRQGVNSGADLFKRVDIALYKSKNGGRNQVNFYKEGEGNTPHEASHAAEFKSESKPKA
ncbi:MAG: GGDEF domain-containing protein [Oligoflexia bacterium]|nr:GGDEF domain-containing protein [Oligoflexia bacterium]MBF0365361.1 GGDEF domain-containing protein [Oligoflexia bacterium]